jgi:hypothetical protein
MNERQKHAAEVVRELQRKLCERIDLISEVRRLVAECRAAKLRAVRNRC